METHNLLLIGTAEQNSVVAKLADRLPVRAEGGRVTANDGVSWDFSGRSLGLLYHNPEAPARLIYWVASDAPAFYAPNAFLMERQGWGYASPDFLLTRVAPSGEVAARCFDSSWDWEPGYAASPFLAEANCSSTGSTTMAADALRRETGADFAVLNFDADTTAPAFAAGETRVADLVAPNYLEWLCAMDLTGKEVIAASELMAKAGRERSARVAKGDDVDPVSQFLPPPDPATISPQRTYLVILPAWSAWNYAITTRTNPQSFRLTGRTLPGHLPAPPARAAVSANQYFRTGTQQVGRPQRLCTTCAGRLAGLPRSPSTWRTCGGSISDLLGTHGCSPLNASCIPLRWLALSRSLHGHLRR